MHQAPSVVVSCEKCGRPVVRREVNSRGISYFRCYLGIFTLDATIPAMGLAGRCIHCKHPHRIDNIQAFICEHSSPAVDKSE